MEGAAFGPRGTCQSRTIGLRLHFESRTRNSLHAELHFSTMQNARLFMLQVKGLKLASSRFVKVSYCYPS